jgi:hypothetical protein
VGLLVDIRIVRTFVDELAKSDGDDIAEHE